MTSTDPSLSNVFAPSATVALRPDLIHRAVWMGSEKMWVIKDPLARNYVYLRDDEHQLLSLATGDRSVADIARQCTTQFAPKFYSVESVLRFFATATEKGLLQPNGVVPKRELTPQAYPAWYTNPLAIRLPGIDPTPALDVLYRLMRPLFSPWGLILGCLLVLVAIAIATMESGRLLLQLTQIVSQPTSVNAAIVLIVIAGCKIIHELAHAIVCRHLGGECREIGVMLLFGIPCLYCDVSGAWLMPRRMSRILVSAAGIMAEMLLASIAVLVWWTTVDAGLSELSLTVISVCAVATLLINGNPLLRYDGYYILSDAIGVPNLAARSNEVLQSAMRRWLWGLPSLSFRLERHAKRQQIALAAYAVASRVYRWSLYVALAIFLYNMVDGSGLEKPLGLIFAVAIGRSIYRAFRTLLTPPHAGLKRSSVAPHRRFLVAMSLVGLLIACCLVPLPRQITAHASIRPGGVNEIFVAQAGTLRHSVEEGTFVQAGDPIAILADPMIDLQLASLRAECETMTTRLQATQRQRVVAPELSNLVPTLERSLHESQRKLALLESQASHLTLRSPTSGKVYAAPKIPTNPPDHRESSFWIGSPIDMNNSGAWLAQGTSLCMVGDPVLREAIAYVRQQDIELVSAGHRASLLLSSYPHRAVEGVVIELASTPITSGPNEVAFLRNASVSPKFPQGETYYQVRIQLDPETPTLPIGQRCDVTIVVRPASLFSRTARYLQAAFGSL